MCFCFPLSVVTAVNSPFLQVRKTRLHDVPHTEFSSLPLPLGAVKPNVFPC